MNKLTLMISICLPLVYFKKFTNIIYIKSILNRNIMANVAFTQLLRLDPASNSCLEFLTSFSYYLDLYLRNHRYITMNKLTLMISICLPLVYFKKFTNIIYIKSILNGNIMANVEFSNSIIMGRHRAQCCRTSANP